MRRPLLASRSMVAPRDDAVHQSHRRAYTEALKAIETFWSEHRDRLRPWDPEGTTVVGVSGGRFGAILQLAQHDLRTRTGRTFLLPGERVDTDALQAVENKEEAILSIGERRFVQGLLGPFTRSAAYRLEVTSPRMEPGRLADEGIVGFHFKGSEGTSVRFAHLLGPSESWDSKSLDFVAGILMATSAIGGHRAEPLPLLLARRELRPLTGFLENFAREVRQHLQSRKLEAAWLSNLNELD